MGKEVEAYVATARSNQRPRRRRRGRLWYYSLLLLICAMLLSLVYVAIAYSSILKLHGVDVNRSTSGIWDRLQHRQNQRPALHADGFGKKKKGTLDAKGKTMNGVSLKPGMGSLAQNSQKLSAGKLLRLSSVYSERQLITDTNFGRSEKNNQRVLLFVTAHANPGHVDFFRYCWPLALRQSQLLSTADILVYTSSDGNSTIDAEFRSVLPEVFPLSFPSDGGQAPQEDRQDGGQNVSLIFYDNPGYQEGAIRAMTDGFHHRWFNRYDWVLRINPDAIIRNDNWILRTMRNESIDAILARCPLPEKNGEYPVHTDFFGFRPSAMPQDSFAAREAVSAETSAAAEFRKIIQANRHAWLPNVRHFKHLCRILGLESPVIHSNWQVSKCKKGRLTGGGAADHELYASYEEGMRDATRFMAEKGRQQ